MFDAMTRSVISWMTLKIPMRDLCGVPSTAFASAQPPVDRFSSVIDEILPVGQGQSESKATDSEWLRVPLALPVPSQSIDSPV